MPLYQEITIVNTKNLEESEIKLYDYNISQEMFMDMMTKVKDHPLFHGVKYFENDIIETRYMSLQRLQYMTANSTTSAYDVTETKVYDIVPIACDDSSPHYVTIDFERQKMPNVAFASSLNYPQRRALRRLTFRLNNRLYLNFQIERCLKRSDSDHRQPSTMMDSVYRKVFLNYNAGKDSDEKEARSLIHAIMDLLVSTCSTSVTK